MQSKTPNAPATDKQINYIKELIRAARLDQWRKADAIRATTTPEALVMPEYRHDARKVANADLMVRVYESITLPSLTQAQASRLIDAIKNNSFIGATLDNPAMAERYGLTAIISEVGARKIEDASYGA